MGKADREKGVGSSKSMISCPGLPSLRLCHRHRQGISGTVALHRLDLSKIVRSNQVQASTRIFTGAIPPHTIILSS